MQHCQVTIVVSCLYYASIYDRLVLYAFIVKLLVVSVDQSRQDARIPSTVFSSSSLTLRLRTPHVGIEE